MRAIWLAVGAAAWFVAVGARADEALPPARYAIRQDVPTTGTHIPRRVFTGSVIPINRRYVDLTAEERRLVKSQYEAMADADEPPFPVDGLESVYAAIAKVQKTLLVTGKLAAEVDVDAQGQASAVRILASPDPKLTQAVASVLMLTRYKPAVCGARPCRMSLPVNVSFSVDH
jgi:hypothetical protein